MFYKVIPLTRHKCVQNLPRHRLQTMIIAMTVAVEASRIGGAGGVTVSSVRASAEIIGDSLVMPSQ
jgi:hypothetical protein